MHKDLKVWIHHLGPITFVLTFLYFILPHSYDYDFHLLGKTDGGYPPLFSGLITYWGELLGSAEMAMLFLSLAFVVVIPYLLIVKIIDTRAGWVYLYGSGIPILLFFAFMLPQAIMNCLLLLSFLSPPVGLGLISIAGPAIHREFVGYLIVALLGLAVRYVWRRYNAV